MRQTWHSWIDYRWGAWLCATWIAGSWFRERRFDDRDEALAWDRWLLLAILFASLVPTLWHALRRDLIPAKERESIRPPRATWAREVHGLLCHSFVAFVLVASYGRVWTLGDIGFRTASPWNWTILMGFLAYHFMSLAQGLLARWFEPGDDGAPELFRRIWIFYFLPRGRFAQALHVLESAVISPIHEEIVYRGFLIYYLGNLLGQPWLAIVFGLALCVTVHLYQGSWAIPSHVLFFTGAVAILYSPAGLLTVLVMHVTNNLVHAYQLPGFAKNYVAHLRDTRQRQQAARAAT